MYFIKFVAFYENHLQNKTIITIVDIYLSSRRNKSVDILFIGNQVPHCKGHN